MAGEGPKRNGYSRIDNVQDPEDPTGRRRTYAWVSVHDVRQTFVRNPWKAHNLRSAVSVLENPDLIFKHIRLGDEEPGWCYCRALRQVWAEDGASQRAARKGTVFSVYLNATMTVFEWGQDEEDPKNKKCPKGGKEGLGTPRGRFGELLWDRD